MAMQHCMHYMMHTMGKGWQTIHAARETRSGAPGTTTNRYCYPSGRLLYCKSAAYPRVQVGLDIHEGEPEP